MIEDVERNVNADLVRIRAITKSLRAVRSIQRQLGLADVECGQDHLVLFTGKARASRDVIIGDVIQDSAHNKSAVCETFWRVFAAVSGTHGQ